MYRLKLFFTSGSFVGKIQATSLSTTGLMRSNELVNSPNDPNLIIAKPKKRINETLDQKKSRLIYQSRKRGMLENDLLLSTFISNYLQSFTEKQVDAYDRLINEPSNDWDIYNWAVGRKPTPVEYDSDVMALFKEHVRNIKREVRIKQPDLD